MPDPYWLCIECGHYWASPERPDRCENCGVPTEALTQCEDVEIAGAESERILIELMEDTDDWSRK